MFEHITPESLKADALSRLRNWNTREGSFADIIVAGAMYELWKWYTALNALTPMFYIDETSGEYIDRRCAERGIFRKPDETDAQLVERYYTLLRKPATSGNVYHYEQWALETPGVGYVKVFPEWDGPGTVKVVVISPDGAAVDSDTITAAYTHIETERPIGASVTVLSAEEFTVDIEARVKLGANVAVNDVVEQYQTDVKAYLKSLINSVYTVNYNRLLYILLSVPGVADVPWLLVNRAVGNLEFSDVQTPVLGSLEVTLDVE